MGLYGTIVVDPDRPGYWPPVDRELTLTLDDLLVEDGHIAAVQPVRAELHRDGPVRQRAADQRRDRVLALKRQAGEVVRLYLVNTANTRLFNFALRGARMKLVGGDSGRYERETFVEEVLLAPSERAVLDVLFDDARQVRLEHRTPTGPTTSARSPSTGDPAAPARGRPVRHAAHRPDLTAERQRIGARPGRASRTRCWRSSPRCLAVRRRRRPRRPTSARCTPRSSASEPGRCPKCGMKLVAARLRPVDLRLPDASRGVSERAGHLPAVRDEAGAGPSGRTADAATRQRGHGPRSRGSRRTATATGRADGLEWEDLMPEINRASDPGNMIWQLSTARPAR